MIVAGAASLFSSHGCPSVRLSVCRLSVCLSIQRTVNNQILSVQVTMCHAALPPARTSRLHFLFAAHQRRTWLRPVIVHRKKTSAESRKRAPRTQKDEVAFCSLQVNEKSPFAQIALSSPAHNKGGRLELAQCGRWHAERASERQIKFCLNSCRRLFNDSSSDLRPRPSLPPSLPNSYYSIDRSIDRSKHPVLVL